MKRIIHIWGNGRSTVPAALSGKPDPADAMAIGTPWRTTPFAQAKKRLLNNSEH